MCVLKAFSQSVARTIAPHCSKSDCPSHGHGPDHPHSACALQRRQRHELDIVPTDSIPAIVLFALLQASVRFHSDLEPRDGGGSARGVGVGGGGSGGGSNTTAPAADPSAERRRTGKRGPRAGQARCARPSRMGQGAAGEGGGGGVGDRGPGTGGRRGTLYISTSILGSC